MPSAQNFSIANLMSLNILVINPKDVIDRYPQNLENFILFKKEITKNKISRGTAHITWTKETIIKGLEILYGETFTSYIKSLNDIKYKTSEVIISIDSQNAFYYRIYYLFKDFLYKKCLKFLEEENKLQFRKTENKILAKKKVGIKMKTTEEYIEEVKKVHGEKTYDYSKIVYNGVNNRITVVCPIHGEFTPFAGNFKRGTGCKACGIQRSANSQRKTKEYFLQQISEIYKDRCDFSNIEYKGANVKVKGILPNGEEWWVSPSSLLRKIATPIEVKQGLIYSKKLNKLITRGDMDRKTQEEFIKEARNKHGNRYDYSKVLYKNAFTKVEIICPIHGSFFVTPDHHIGKGVNCPKCKISHGEEEVLNFLESNNLLYIREYTFENCKDKRALPFDFYLPQQNICIEFQGQHHYQIVDFDKKPKTAKFNKIQHETKLKEKFESVKKHDLIKKEYCKKNNIPLICVPYNKNVIDFLRTSLKELGVNVGEQ